MISQDLSAPPLLQSALPSSYNFNSNLANTSQTVTKISSRLTKDLFDIVQHNCWTSVYLHKMHLDRTQWRGGERRVCQLKLHRVWKRAQLRLDSGFCCIFFTTSQSLWHPLLVCLNKRRPTCTWLYTRFCCFLFIIRCEKKNPLSYQNNKNTEILTANLTRTSEL